MKIFFSIIITAISVLTIEGQELYRVYFTDKGENQALLDQPFRFLSPHAIERRAAHNIPIDESDLPVSQVYLKTIDIPVIQSNKWFNYALLKASEKQLERITSLPFIKKVEKVKPSQKYFTALKANSTTTNVNYGLAANQIEMHRGQVLHQNGYLGEGMVIAVLDGGFSGTQSLPAFDSLWMNNRIIGTYDFVQKDTNVFDVGSHGTRVLSVLGGYIEDGLAGSAPRASYWLLKSEDETKETVVEMDNWAAAAEFADSVGADIISSSLGYNTFDGGVGDYQYADFDGNTTIVTKAADKAAQKGILVINSAGNEGSAPWGYILAPADGDSVLSVGAVDANGNYSFFSGRGPTADGRLKPDVVAQGSNTIIAGSGGQAVPGNGTSFSCPVISGLAACFWQANPSMNNMDIYRAIKQSAHQHFAPDNYLGFGIPNFEAALYAISVDEEINLSSDVNFEIYPIPAREEVYIKSVNLNSDTPAELALFDIRGAQLFKTHTVLSDEKAVRLSVPEQSGTYILSVKTSGFVYLERIIR